MPHRRTFLAAALALVAVLPAEALAEEGRRIAFTDTAFAEVIAAGDPVLVEISAPWCPTCRAQKAVLADLLDDPDFADLVVVEVDFDSQKDVVRSFGANVQSTLIALKGNEETGRAVGVTDPAAIEALLRTAL